MPENDDDYPIKTDSQTHRAGPIQVITVVEMGKWSLWTVMRVVCQSNEAFAGGEFRIAATFIEYYACGHGEIGIASYSLNEKQNFSASETG